MGQKFIVGQFRLAHAVTRPNYDLNDEQVDGLVSWASDDEGGARDQVLEVAYGRAPNATSDGGLSA